MGPRPMPRTLKMEILISRNGRRSEAEGAKLGPLSEDLRFRKGLSPKTAQNEFWEYQCFFRCHTLTLVGGGNACRDTPQDFLFSIGLPRDFSERFSRQKTPKTNSGSTIVSFDVIL